eukprot:10681950-Karenia_brevis.AAC.1
MEEDDAWSSRDSTRRTTIRTTIIYTEAMDVIYAEGDETTINTTKRLRDRVQSFLESRVRGISL